MSTIPQKRLEYESMLYELPATADTKATTPSKPIDNTRIQWVKQIKEHKKKNHTFMSSKH